MSQKCIVGRTVLSTCEHRHARPRVVIDDRSCGTAGTDPLPPTAKGVKTTPASLEKLHAESRALSSIFSAESGAEIVSEQACYWPKPARGRPSIGQVKDEPGVWVAGG